MTAPLHLNRKIGNGKKSYITDSEPFHQNQLSLKLADWVHDPKVEAFYIAIKIG